MARKIRDDLRALLFGLVFQIREAMQDAVEDAEAGLTVQQVAVLRTLVECGPLSQAELANRLGKDKAQISRIISELTNKCLIRKTRDTDDKRSFVIEARLEVTELVQTFLDREARLIDVMTAGMRADDILILHEFLSRMRDNLGKTQLENHFGRP